MDSNLQKDALHWYVPGQTWYTSQHWEADAKVDEPLENCILLKWK